jgi:hypothetical protein
MTTFVRADVNTGVAGAPDGSEGCRADAWLYQIAGVNWPSYEPTAAIDHRARSVEFEDAEFVAACRTRFAAHLGDEA